MDDKPSDSLSETQSPSPAPSICSYHSSVDERRFVGWLLAVPVMFLMLEVAARDIWQDS
jgi:bacteriorhodopsin